MASASKGLLGGLLGAAVHQAPNCGRAPRLLLLVTLLANKCSASHIHVNYGSGNYGSGPMGSASLLLERATSAATLDRVISIRLPSWQRRFWVRYSISSAAATVSATSHTTATINAAYIAAASTAARDPPGRGDARRRGYRIRPWRQRGQQPPKRAASAAGVDVGAVSVSITAASVLITATIGVARLRGDKRDVQPRDGSARRVHRFVAAWDHRHIGADRRDGPAWRVRRRRARDTAALGRLLRSLPCRLCVRLQHDDL